MASNDHSDWTPNYEELKDIMRPIEAVDDEEDRYYDESRAEPPDLGDQIWADKVAKEDREHRELQKQPRRRKESPQREQQGNKGVSLWVWLGQLRQNRWLVLFRNYMPYGLLLLLAPLINGEIEFLNSAGEVSFRLSYVVVLLLTALPMLVLWFFLHPTGDPPFFRLALLSLPVEFYFLLLFNRSQAVILLFPALLLLFGVLFYHLVYNRKRMDQPDRHKVKDDDTPLNAALVEEAIRKKRLKDLGKDERPRMDKSHFRKLMRFGVRYAAALFGLFIILGAALNGLPQSNGSAETDAESRLHTLPSAALPEVEQQPFSLDLAMEEIALLSPARWGDLSQDERQRALQALLNAEIENLDLGFISIRDEEIIRLKGKKSISIHQALRSGKNKLDERILAVCYAAYYKKLQSNPDVADPKNYEANAMAYAEQRRGYFTAMIAQYWLDGGTGQNLVE